MIASSSSGLLISRVTTKCKHPERCVIGHPFNPPHLIPLVEVVGGAKTSPDAVTKAMNFYREIGKHPIHIKKEVRGHVANRLQAALWREAIHLVTEGVVSVADADAAIAYGPGLRWALMGPHLTFHMAGGDGGMKHFMDHLGPANQSWMDDLGTPRLDAKTQKAIIDGVTEEAAGRSMDDLRRWRDRKLIEILRVSGNPEQRLQRSTTPAQTARVRAPSPSPPPRRDRARGLPCAAKRAACGPPAKPRTRPFQKPRRSPATAC